MTQEQIVILKLIKIAVSGKPCDIPKGVCWQKVIELVASQGILGLCFDAVELLPPDSRPDMDSLMDWLGQTSYMETCYEEHLKTIIDLATIYSTIDVRMMLLKGYGLSQFWPKPNHRPVGDIDIYLYGRWREADKMLEEKHDIKVDNGHHHHSVFTFEGSMVENHYDFINVHSHASNSQIEDIFKSLAINDDRSDPEIHNLYYPSEMLNMLFVARHNAIHFASEKMTFRQVLDWAFLVRHLSEGFDWITFWQEVEKMGMTVFVLSMNTLCVQYFGFEQKMFINGVTAQDALVKKMLNDIFEPENTGAEKKGLAYLLHRSRLWWTNRWKHKMVYSDSLISTFLVQLKSHLMKPKTIFGW